MNKKVLIISFILMLVIVLSVIGVKAIATKNNSYEYRNGKPVIYEGQDIPEELMGEDVVYAFPSNSEDLNTNREEAIQVQTEEMKKEEAIEALKAQGVKFATEDEIKREIASIDEAIAKAEAKEEKFVSIMEKYYGKEEIDRIHKAMTEESPLNNSGFHEGNITIGENGMKYIQYALDILETKNPTYEERESIIDKIQRLVTMNEIGDKELEEKILSLEP